MVVSCYRGDAPSGRAVQEADLDQVRLDHFLDRFPVLTDRCRDGPDTDRTTVELVDYRQKQLPIFLVQPEAVDLHAVERGLRGGAGNPAVAQDLGIISDAPQQPVRDPRRASRAACKLHRSAGLDLDTENFG